MISVKKLSYETQVATFALLPSVPLIVFTIVLMLQANISIWLRILLVFIGSVTTGYVCYEIHRRLAYHFRSLHNLLDAMVQGDYSLRGRAHLRGGPFSDVVQSINALADKLSKLRIESTERQILIQTIIDHIDVAIIAVSQEGKLSFANPCAHRLFGLEAGADAAGALLEQLAMVESAFARGDHLLNLNLGKHQGRFSVHVDEFREAGVPHKLILIKDVGPLLRSVESTAWQSLVRVISHEINNSLAPIASIGQTLSNLVKREQVECKDDLLRGLDIIVERSKSLSAFVEHYKTVHKIPQPKKEWVSVQNLIQRVVGLFDGAAIDIACASDLEILADPLLLEQVLINLIKNACEAISATGDDGVITIHWHQSEAEAVELRIIDEGVGIANADNLFVPFYSTKRRGTGTGLVLCRQIIEAHGGQLTVFNRRDRRGVCAAIKLPVR